MKVGSITKPNTKGQIVIPKAMRKELGITPGSPLHVVLKEGGVFIHPITEVRGPGSNARTSYTEILQHTKGTWSDEEWRGMRRRRQKTERVASERRKRAW